MILNYDLYIFDFDGTLLDTEDAHYKAWNKLLPSLTITEYYIFCHSLDKTLFKKYITDNGLDYDNIYKQKQEIYSYYISVNNIEFISGAEDFLKLLILNKKPFVIVTNTSINNINIFKDKYPILNNADKIYTKENYINKKPDPECYITVCNDYKHLIRKIGFEDSLIGLYSLYWVNSITPILIYKKDYYWNDIIIKDYNRAFHLTDYNFNVYNILQNNINEFQNNMLNMNNIINNISLLLKDQHHIYLSGMGKSGYVCKKCASTWQSLSINCSYIDLPNLPHGDFGIFRNNDILILISNSGNTEENIYILKYLKTFKIKVKTISIVANSGSKMEEFSDHTFILNNIREADIINMTPSTSSIIFMALLDGIAINLKRDVSKEEFQIYHPAGSLGRR